LFIPDPDPDFLPIPDQGVKKAPDPESGSATLLPDALILLLMFLLVSLQILFILLLIVSSFSF
jgi:hypothetical protein